MVRDKLRNVCMNSKRHKQEPGPEDKLYGEVQRAELAQRLRKLLRNYWRRNTGKVVPAPHHP